jgi:hypothetical protein
VFDPFFAWLEATSLRLWIVESPSLLAFPAILTAHTIGMGLLAGLSVALDLRLLGVAPRIPAAAFARFAPVMWLGFWINVTSGLALLLAYPTKALTNPVFYVKLALVAAALIVLRLAVRRLRSEDAISTPARVLAVVSLVLWASAITAGRLLAYTCTRLMVDTRCL